MVVVLVGGRVNMPANVQIDVKGMPTDVTEEGVADIGTIGKIKIDDEIGKSMRWICHL